MPRKYIELDIDRQCGIARTDLTPVEIAYDVSDTASDNPRDFLAGVQADMSRAEQSPSDLRYGQIHDASDGLDLNELLTDAYLKGHVIGQAVRAVQLDIAEGRR